ncbi:MAG: hypothetical protein ACR2PY_02230 [Salinispira sp.]
MNVKIRLLTAHIFLVGISLFFSILQWIQPPPALLPWLIIEVSGGSNSVTDFLEERNFTPVLRKESALLPISRFGLWEFQRITALESRMGEEDIRILPQLPLLIEQFRLDGGELIFVPGKPENILASLRSYDGDYVVHSYHPIPPLYSAVIWGITALILLVFFKRRRWTIPVIIAFLPGFFVQAPLYPAVQIILCICVREMIFFSGSEFERHVNVNPHIFLPERFISRITFTFKKIRSYALFPAIWTCALLLILCIYALAVRKAAGLYVIAVIPVLMIIAKDEFIRIVTEAQKREHRLFFAAEIMPAWKKASRQERFAVLTALLLAVSIPLTLRMNVFPLLHVQELGDIRSAEDLDSLRNRVSVLLDQRVKGATEDTEREDMEHSEENSYIVDILLADRAYQQIFPYLSLTPESGAGRYENGKVYLTRYVSLDEGLDSYEERVFDLTNIWLISELSEAGSTDMLRLYTDGKKWYDLSREFSVRRPSRRWNLLLEMIILAMAGLPWIGRWHFTPVKKLMKKTFA